MNKKYILGLLATGLVAERITAVCAHKHYSKKIDDLKIKIKDLKIENEAAMIVIDELCNVLNDDDTIIHPDASDRFKDRVKFRCMTINW